MFAFALGSFLTFIAAADVTDYKETCLVVPVGTSRILSGRCKNVVFANIRQMYPITASYGAKLGVTFQGTLEFIFPGNFTDDMDLILKNSEPSCEIVLDAIREKNGVVLRSKIGGDIDLKLLRPDFEGGIIVEANILNFRKLPVVLVPFTSDMYGGKKKTSSATIEVEKVAARLHNDALQELPPKSKL